MHDGRNSRGARVHDDISVGRCNGRFLPCRARYIPGTTIEYPRRLRDMDVDGYIRIQLTVSPTGKIIRCEVLVSSGQPELDAEACKGGLTAKAHPARDASGQPAYGTFNNAVTFLMDRKVLAAPPNADLSLVVNHLPEGQGPFSQRKATLAIDGVGQVTSCKSEIGKRSGLDALDKALCSAARSALSFTPARNEENKPVDSIQTFRVEFSQADAPTLRTESGKVAKNP
jgi:TonB family protein